jgi:hypothetical protein
MASNRLEVFYAPNHLVCREKPHFTERPNVAEVFLHIISKFHRNLWAANALNFYSTPFGDFPAKCFFAPFLTASVLSRTAYRTTGKKLPLPASSVSIAVPKKRNED